ncbi:MAG TPA: hypothetical protein VFE50_05920 [Cyclobacteriaceae bacterium]|nr:hypothetical protein [Cyclobacteriaceae bacterium]
MNRLKISRFIIALAIVAGGCNNQELSPGSHSIEQLSIDVAQISGQLASGASFAIEGSSSDSTLDHRPGKGPHGKHGMGGPGAFGKNPGVLDGLNLLAPTDELLAIADAESASDIRGLRMSKNGGATIRNYDANGNEVTPGAALTAKGKNGPQGCSFSGKQFPEVDSLLSRIVKTVIDFGSGVTYRRDTVEIIREGKIIITRTSDGTAITETTVFENYEVNGIRIEGTKKRTSTFDEETGAGSSTTTVSGGKITFTDGTVATWTSDRSRTSNIDDGVITTVVDTNVTANGEVIYSHKTTSPLTENIACKGRRPAPVRGVVETTYRNDNISIDFGDGSCTNRTITMTVNGVTTTRTIGE